MISFLLKKTFKTAVPLLFILAFFAKVPVFAQIKFSVTCPNTSIGKNEILEVQFKIENAHRVTSINPPQFKNFQIVGGPNQQSGLTNVNGKIEQYVAISFFLQPLAQGKFTIGHATAMADGKQYVTKPVSIKVTDNVSSPNNNAAGNLMSPFTNFGFESPVNPTRQFDDYLLKNGEDPGKKIKNNLFVKLEVSKTKCYVGEPITASYKLYTRLRSETSVTEAPSFNGFSVSDLDVNDNVNIEKINGRPYNVYVLRKVQLYPMQPGSITLDPVVTDNTVTFLKAEYADRQNNDLFFELLENFSNAHSPVGAVIDKKATLKSDPVNITVKPLPEKNEPVTFKGAVGKFSIQATLDKNKITTKDEGILRVEISGQGNIQLVNAPKIEWPVGIDGFDASIKSNIEKGSVPMKGSKTYTYPFLINTSGSYVIDSISFSYFDPESESYKIIKTPSLSIEVINGEGVSNTAIGKNNSKNKKEEENYFKNHYSIIIAGSITVLALLGLFIFGIYSRNKKKKSSLARNNSTHSKPEFIIPENPLLAAHQKLIEKNDDQFYTILDSSLKNYLAAKFKIPKEDITKKRLNEEMDKYNISLGTTLMVHSLLEEVELNLYSVSTPTHQLNKVFEKASEVISLLNKQVC